MGELVPYDKVWRTGRQRRHDAEDDGGAGDRRHARACGHLHALHAARREGVEAHHQQADGQWGTQYSEAQDLARVDLKVGATAAPVEQFTITLTGTGAAAGLLTMEWETTKLTIPFTVK